MKFVKDAHRRFTIVIICVWPIQIGMKHVSHATSVTCCSTISAMSGTQSFTARTITTGEQKNRENIRIKKIDFS